MNRSRGLKAVCMLAAWLAASAWPYTRESGSASEPASKYHTTVNALLQIELETKDSGYSLNLAILDSVIDDVKSRVTVRKEYSRDDALTVLRTIYQVLDEKHYVHSAWVSDAGNVRLLCDALTPQVLDETTRKRLNNAVPAKASRLRPGDTYYVFDCDTACLMYLAVGEALGFPLALTDASGHAARNAAGHALVRWQFSATDYLNWDTTDAATYTDEQIQRHFRIPPEAVRRGAYLRTHDRDSLESLVRGNVGNHWQSVGRFDKAIAQYDKAIALDPLDPGNYNNRGIAYKSLGNYDAATLDLSKAIELDPAMLGAYTNRGICWNYKKEYDKAIADATKALELDSQWASGYEVRGTARRFKRQLAEALVDLSRAIQLDPKAKWSFFHRGNIRLQEADYPAAIADLTAAIEIDPKFFNAYAVRANVFAAKSEAAKAIADAETCVSLRPDDAGAYAVRAVVLRKLGKSDAAEADERKVKELQLKSRASGPPSRAK